MAFVGALENGAVRRMSEVRHGLGRGRCGGRSRGRKKPWKDSGQCGAQSKVEREFG
jgi:hypothetical protein